MSTAGRTAIAGNCGRTGRNQTHGSVAAHGLVLPSNGQCPPQTPQWRACRTEYFWTRPDEEASPSQASPQRQRRSPWAATVSKQLEEGQRLPCRTSSLFARSADFPPCVVGELNYLETVREPFSESEHFSESERFSKSEHFSKSKHSELRVHGHAVHQILLLLFFGNVGYTS